MTDNERNILREERVMQLQIGLSQRAGLADAVCNEFGGKGLEVIRKEVDRDISSWIKSVIEQFEEEGKELNIETLHDFLWEGNKDENIEFSFEDKTDKEDFVTRKYTVTKCPLAEHALKNGITEWGKVFFCDTYPIITGTFNPEIEFESIQKMMDGEDCCIFSYRGKNS